MVLLVEPGGGHGESAGGDHVHKKAVGAGSADGNHLYKGDKDGDGHAGHGSHYETGNDDDGILGVVAEEASHGWDDLAYQHGYEADCGEHGDDGHVAGGYSLFAHFFFPPKPKNRKSLKIQISSGGNKAYLHLLSSRLYCRFRSCTGSCLTACGLYRRSGITPCPEDFLFLYNIA